MSQSCFSELRMEKRKVLARFSNNDFCNKSFLYFQEGYITFSLKLVYRIKVSRFPKSQKVILRMKYCEVLGFGKFWNQGNQKFTYIVPGILWIIFILEKWITKKKNKRTMFGSLGYRRNIPRINGINWQNLTIWIELAIAIDSITAAISLAALFDDIGGIVMTVSAL